MAEQTKLADEPTASGGEQAAERGWAQPDKGKQQGDEEGGGASHQKNLERPSAEDIYQQVALNARSELKRSTLSLAISGFAGGIFMGLSGLGTALALALFGAGNLAHFIASMFYPLGFIVVIVGRAQLFTENTLYPVALVLSEKRELWNTLRLWCTVLPANVLGALAFSALASRTSALQPAAQRALVQLGLTAGHASDNSIFWSAVTAGWIIATAAWLVSGSHSVTGSVMILWMLTFVVGLGGFAHCIATSGEIFSAVLTGQFSVLGYLRWLGLAVAGNVCGGVLMVTLLEYGQAVYGKSGNSEADA
jgi:formate/nitrite transporter FocA (FNT family)